MSNLYRKFISLIPSPPLMVGQVIAVGGGIVTVELPGGGVIKARGQATTGQNVFVRDGVIEGPAPDLPVVTIDL